MRTCDYENRCLHQCDTEECPFYYKCNILNDDCYECRSKCTPEDCIHVKEYCEWLDKKEDK